MLSTSAAIFVAQVLYAAHRPDRPGLADQDPSGIFGDEDAPFVRIVALGDSSVTAPGVVPLDASWARRMARHVASTRRVELVSLAKGGAKARNVVAHQLPAALECGADLAFVSVGANDALRGTPLTRYEREMRTIVGSLAAVTAGVGLSGVGDLGTVPRLPSFARGIGRVRGRSFDRALVRVAASHPNVVKARTWGDGWRLFDEGDPDVVFAADHFHASARGHDVFTAAWMPVVERLETMLQPRAPSAPPPRRRESSR
jgi:lysophospholipase L1-like esterase